MWIPVILCVLLAVTNVFWKLDSCADKMRADLYAHGNRDSLEFIQRTGAAVMTYPDGIQWDDKIVRLVIGIAFKGEEHLDILNRIVEVAGTEEATDSLVDNATPENLYIKLNGLT